MDGEARWLDDDERQTWLSWVFTTRLLWEELDRDLQREAGLPFGYYEILVMLSEAPERTLRMSELADATQSSRSRLSHAITRLEEFGWVRRATCETIGAARSPCSPTLGSRPLPPRLPTTSRVCGPTCSTS